ncbi:MAG: hypothetical protein ACM3SY_09755 [Candidatus Omnitrophota bacterium]
MAELTNLQERFDSLKQAFDSDGFNVRYFNDPQTGEPIGYKEYQGKIGVLAESKTAINLKSQEPKRVYYVEGNGYQMGYLTGLLAEDQVSLMTTDFVENIIFAFFNIQTPDTGLMEFIKQLMIKIIYEISKSMAPDIPQAYQDELKGILAGCQEANPQTKVTWDNLWALNFGIDCLLTHIYTGKLFKENNIPAFLLKLPIMCNAFSLYNDPQSAQPSVGGNVHYFGRDFMFATAGVFEYTACLFIYNPVDAEGKPLLPIVSQSAPGMIGSVAAMNSEGLGIGVDMSPSQLCNVDRPGFNSLCLNRDLMQYCRTTEELVERMIDTQRGVSWLYPVGEGKSDHDNACVIEAGAKLDSNTLPYFDYVPDYYKEAGVLPDEAFIEAAREKYHTPEPQKGVMVRDGNYNFPTDYLSYNENLWNAFNQELGPKLMKTVEDVLEDLPRIFKGMKIKDLLSLIHQQLKQIFSKAQYDPEAFGEEGFINKTWTETNCPGPFYFAPQRETLPNGAWVSNHCLTPEMRYMAMNDWVALVASADLNDIQWRYDALNVQILESLKCNPSGIDEPTAWRLIEFLSPNPAIGFYPEYYNKDFQQDWKEIVIEGSISLFELKGRKMISHFGFYGDEPITIHLLKYINQ